MEKRGRPLSPPSTDSESPARKRSAAVETSAKLEYDSSNSQDPDDREHDSDIENTSLGQAADDVDSTDGDEESIAPTQNSSADDLDSTQENSFRENADDDHDSIRHDSSGDDE
ncbi:hypothetical protein QAD02_000802 [Eretmocerus hayati]|uniref:Uncharacterized protein n=1 Tax=Eretmocerus hayati TaxID=131215 RepID=A0ACC2NFH2_9HYME|nr:hypothetical protein QAD02_000802 [Eretmocerus hayati]